jgi:hypothetical protein
MQARLAEAGLRVTMRRQLQRDRYRMFESVTPPPKAADSDFLGRFREVISDPLNLLIERVSYAGIVEGNEVYLHNGIRVPVSGASAYYGQFSQLLAINRGVHEPLEEYVFQEVLKILPASPQMIELGAYWAHYSMWLKQRRPQAIVIMVEPDPSYLAVGRANFLRNGFEGEFILAAVAKGRWELDSFLKSSSIPHLDVLHVDIQGYEAQLLDGARDALRNAMIDFLFVSTHSQALHQSVTDELARFDYRIEVSSDFDNDTTSFDGFVFASSPQTKQVFGEFRHVGRTKIAAVGAEHLVRAVLEAHQNTLSR